MREAKNNSSNLGKKGEDFACKFLVRQGYKILKRNYRSKYAEIDLVAQVDDILVFVEVKTRRSARYGLPEEAVNTKKIEKIKMAAYYYIQMEKPKTNKYRIDVVSIVVDKNENVSAHIIQTG
ncbi:YraN family protein [Candidatus Woesebacteria bacterium]|nr:MAG: YraN family protein [Candidatus Woesebacteria bacterium]